MEFAPFNFFTQIHPLVYIGLLLLLSYTGGWIANSLKTPRVTGYLVTGMLLSPSVLGLFNERLVKVELSWITQIALSIIAFSIGGSLGLAKMKRLGKPIVWITLFQALGAFITTTSLLAVLLPIIHYSNTPSGSFWNLYLPVALIVGAISAATAPAAILAIIHEYRATGPFTTVLLGVVALDDALTIILYASAIGVARSLLLGEAFTLQNLFLVPGLSILIALVTGGAFGACLRGLIRFVPRREAMLGVTAGLIFMTSGVAMSLGASPLLGNMMLGFVVANFVAHHEDLFDVMESIEEPIFGMFFTLAGAHLNLAVVKTAGWFALFITMGRFGGKLLGTLIGARISDAPDTVKRYLGFALLPTAGVTVGLVLQVKEALNVPQLSEIMVSGVLG